MKKLLVIALTFSSAGLVAAPEKPSPDFKKLIYLRAFRTAIEKENLADAYTASQLGADLNVNMFCCFSQQDTLPYVSALRKSREAGRLDIGAMLVDEAARRKIKLQGLDDLLKDEIENGPPSAEWLELFLYAGANPNRPHDFDLKPQTPPTTAIAYCRSQLSGEQAQAYEKAIALLKRYGAKE